MKKFSVLTIANENYTDIQSDRFVVDGMFVVITENNGNKVKIPIYQVKRILEYNE